MSGRIWHPKITSEGRLDLSHVWYAKTPEDCEQVMRALADSKLTGFDTEYGGYEQDKQHPVGRVKGYAMQFSTEEHPYIFVQCWGEGRRNPHVFKRWFEDESAPKTLHNYKADAHVVAEWGYDLKGLAGDTMVMDYTLNVPRPHSLKNCYFDYFGKDTSEYRDTFVRPRQNKNGTASKTNYLPTIAEMLGIEGIELTAGNEDAPLWYKKPGYMKRYVPARDVLVDYAVKDPFYTLELFNYLKDRLSNIEWCARGSMWDYYKTFELPYTETLFGMERRGMALSQEFLDNCDTTIMNDVVELEQEFMREAVKLGADPESMLSFNMNAPQQIGGLFDGFGFKFTSFTEKTKLPQVTPEQLHKNRSKRTSKIIDAYLEWKRLTKIHGTYTLPFQEASNFYGGRVHTQFKQIGTKTGRLSSATPNLQNIPRAGDTDKYGIRKAFVAEKGMVLADADLAQVEMRLMAHLTNDEAMIKAILRGHDLHAVTAADCFREVNEFVAGQKAAGIHEDDLFCENGPVKKEFPIPRQRSKGLNFGIAYGMTEIRYAKETGANKKEAIRVLRAFFDGKPGLAKGIKNTHRFCHRHGFIRTLLRRYVHIPEIHSHKFGEMKYAERQSFNYVIQGSAADMLKMSMLLIDRDEDLADMGVTMNLQVHDELVFQMPDDKATRKRAKRRIEDYMSRPYKHFGMKDLRVPTPAELNFGYSWADAK